MAKIAALKEQQAAQEQSNKLDDDVKFVTVKPAAAQIKKNQVAPIWFNFY